MNTKHLFKFVTLVFSVTFSTTLPLSTRADTFTWDGPATGGVWNITTPYSGTTSWLNGTNTTYVYQWSTGSANWLQNGTAATRSPGLISGANLPADNSIISDDVIIGPNVSDLTISAPPSHYILNRLTIASGVTVNLPNASPRTAMLTLNNSGLMQVTGSATRILSGYPNNAAGHFINSGTLQALGGYALLRLSATLNNAGGLLRADQGGMLDFNGTPSVTGGAVYIGVSSTFVYDNVQFTLNLNNTKFDNLGHLDWSRIAGNLNVNHDKILNLSGGEFTNSGTVTYLVSGSHTDINPGYTYDLRLSNDITAVNTGVMTFRNIDGLNPNRTTYGKEEAMRFQLNLSGTGSFSNSGYVEIYNNTAGVTTGATGTRTQYTAMTVNNGAKFTNSGTIRVALGADTLDDAQHFATLLVNTDWTNDGAVILDSAGQTAAKATLVLDAGTDVTKVMNLTGGAGTLKNYFQTNAAAVLQLNHGAQLKAGAVSISGGVLSVSGTNDILAANTVFGNSAIWELGTLGDDVLNFSGSLDLGGAMLSVSGQLDEGKYLLANLGGALTGTLNFSGLSSDFDYLLDNSTDPGKLYLNITAIPEPSTWALLLTGGVLLFILRRTLGAPSSCRL